MTAAVADERARAWERARTLAAFVKAEFQAPVLGLRDRVDVLAREAARAGLTVYDDDLGRIGAASDRLFHLVAEIFDMADDEVGREPNADWPTGRTIRHDLRTPITAILGYGELLAEDARDRDDVVLFAPLADMLEAASRLLREIDRIAPPDAPAAVDASAPADANPVPDLLRHAVAMADRLQRRRDAPRRNVVGRILVVDDNAAVRDLISRRLVRDGHHVSVCAGGEAALDMSAGGSFDLLLLDLMMPGLNGLDVLERLRARTSTQSLPVIVISALDETEAAVRCIEAGADDFLSKPLNETLLRARITSSLERKFLKDREQQAVDELRQEQARADALLRNVLPARIVARLQAGEAVVADHFDAATVLFCDLVGFTALSARLEPVATQTLLNDVFSGFDALAVEHGLEKIKTIGDAYMAVGGLFETDPEHARRAVAMACDMSSVLRAVDPDGRLAVRIGVDTGPVAAGIIGRDKFFYDVWGDTVNTASRLEAAGEPGRVHVSERVRDAVIGAYVCAPREPIELKGKGVQRTFYVDGKG